MKTRYKYLIGVDPGVHTGFCIWCSPEKKIVLLEKLKIHRAMEKVLAMEMNNPENILVRVEDARLRRWVPWQKDDKAERGRNRGAGSVMRDAQIWEEFLQDYKIAYEMVAPMHNKTKTNAAYFKKISGFQQRTNHHERDAAMLVIGF